MLDLSRRRFLGALVALPFVRLPDLARAFPPAEADAATTPVTSASPPAEVPVGTVLPYAGECPPGWLPCDGRLVGVREYPTLYAVLGQTYGASPVRREFAVPDLRARRVAGAHDHAHAWTTEASNHSHSIADHVHLAQYVIKA